MRTARSSTLEKNHLSTTHVIYIYTQSVYSLCVYIYIIMYGSSKCFRAEILLTPICLEPCVDIRESASKGNRPIRSML